MPTFKKPIVAPDLVGFTVEHVWFERYKQTLVGPDRDLGNNKRGPKPEEFKEVTIGLGKVEVSIQGENGESYPAPGFVFVLHFYDDPGSWAKPGKGNGVGGMCDALVANASPKGYGDFLTVKSDPSKTAYDALAAAFRTGTTDAEGRENVAKLLVKTGRVLG